MRKHSILFSGMLSAPVFVAAVINTFRWCESDLQFHAPYIERAMVRRFPRKERKTTLILISNVSLSRVQRPSTCTRVFQSENVNTASQITNNVTAYNIIHLRLQFSRSSGISSCLILSLVFLALHFPSSHCFLCRMQQKTASPTSLPFLKKK